jgi:CubicO group peptidase (beta-lactamase class C family)
MYSGGGYTIMQQMVTDIENRPYSEIMQSEVLNPLGMEKSTFENPLPVNYHAIAATGYRANGNEVEGKWPIYPEMAAAGLWTTPSQLILWAREIQQIYQNQKDGLLKTQTVNEMLVPGINNYGLGPGSNEHTFGHGGADEGFRANLVAWKDHPIAVVIMINSDNGSIIQEILLSIFKEYDLPGIEADKRTVKAQSQEQRELLIGDYEIPQLGKVIIDIKDEGLEVKSDFDDEVIFLLPESDSIYFNANRGNYLKFIYHNEKVTGFRYGQFEAQKLEK